MFFLQVSIIIFSIFRSLYHNQKRETLQWYNLQVKRKLRLVIIMIQVKRNIFKHYFQKWCNDDTFSPRYSINNHTYKAKLIVYQSPTRHSDWIVTVLVTINNCRQQGDWAANGSVVIVLLVVHNSGYTSVQCILASHVMVIWCVGRPIWPSTYPTPLFLFYFVLSCFFSCFVFIPNPSV